MNLFVRWRGPAWLLAVLQIAFVAASPGPAVAEPSREPEPLTCGVPLARHLDPDASDTYRLSVAPASAVVVSVSDTSGDIGLLSLEAPSSEETCTGTLEVTAPGSSEIEVSDCLGHDSGDYTIAASVVAQGASNCGLPLPCGATPRVLSFKVAGEVDAHTFSGAPGDQVTLTATDVSGSIGYVRLRVFDPDGTQITGADSCRSASKVLTLGKRGTYTALASACGLPKTGNYGIALEGSACPAGPDITYFGIARADSTPLSPLTYDESGRPLYVVSSGAGFFVVIEARPGADGQPVALQAFAYDPNDPNVLPDLQMLLSRPLGNGSTAVCDKALPNRGGVPATSPLEFSIAQAAADAINDLGCRVNDGTGQSLGVGTSQDACTVFPDGQFHFVDAMSSAQFCIPIAQPWSFPRGTTVVKARIRDMAGTVGAEREILVRVGEEEQAALVKDIAPGPGSSNPSHLIAYQGSLYFTAENALSGVELWRSNGTASGTMLATDVRPGSAGSFPDNLTIVNGRLFFSADDGTRGVELWPQVADINPGSASSVPQFLTKLGTTLLFAADDGTNGNELWKTDGISDDTTLVKDINPGPPPSNPHGFTLVNGTMLFVADDGTNGTELWATDATMSGTRLVADIQPGATGSSPANLTSAGGKLFFSAADGSRGVELWKSDGTPAGTVLVRDILRGATGSAPANFTAIGSTLYFTADDGVHGVELWRSDGTELGTLLVADIRPGPDGSSPTGLTDVNGTLFFAADDGVHGVELWKSDGTVSGTVLVSDIDPGPAPSMPTDLADADGTLVFAATDGVSGVEPWRSNGSAHGTVRIQDIAAGDQSSHPNAFTVVASKLFFAADDNVTGRELWMLPLSALQPAGCPGDCNDDLDVSIVDLIVGMNVVLGTTPLSACPSIDANNDGAVTVDEVVGAVNLALHGCSG